MTDDDLRHIVGRQTAFECLALSLARTHPNPDVLAKDFLEISEVLKTHLLNLPVPEAYLDSFESAKSQILSKTVVSE